MTENPFNIVVRSSPSRQCGPKQQRSKLGWLAGLGLVSLLVAMLFIVAIVNSTRKPEAPRGTPVAAVAESTKVKPRAKTAATSDTLQKRLIKSISWTSWKVGSPISAHPSQKTEFWYSFRESRGDQRFVSRMQILPTLTPPTPESESFAGTYSGAANPGKWRSELIGKQGSVAQFRVVLQYDIGSTFAKDSGPTRNLLATLSDNGELSLCWLNDDGSKGAAFEHLK